MHFLLFGASGRTGKLVIEECLSHGHSATALVRDPSALKPRDRLTIVQGIPTNAADIDKAFLASRPIVPDAAIVTLSSVRTSDSPFAKQASPPRLMADSSKNIVVILRNHGLSRIVTMSTVRVGDSWANLPFPAKVFLGYTNFRHALDDHNIVDEEMRSSGMEWILL